MDRISHVLKISETLCEGIRNVPKQPWIIPQGKNRVVSGAAGAAAKVERRGGGLARRVECISGGKE